MYVQKIVVLIIARAVRGSFVKPGIYGSGRIRADVRHVLRRTLSLNGRGRRAAVDFVVCFGCGGN